MDPSIIAAGISGLANIGGGFMSAQGAAAANQQNAFINQQNIAAAQQQWNQQQTFQNNVNVANWAFADKVNQENFDFAREMTGRSEADAATQMAFQERMSGTAYQRAMADMKAAGLNPILAYQQGGASTPSGAMGQVQNASATTASGSGTTGSAPRASLSMVNSQADMGRAIGRAASSAVDAYRTTEQSKLIGKQQDLTDEDIKKRGFERGNLDADTQKKHAEEDLVHQQVVTERERADMVKAQRDAAKASSASSYADAAYRMGQKVEADKYGYNQGPQTHERFLRQVEDLGQTLNHTIYGP